MHFKTARNRPGKTVTAFVVPGCLVRPQDESKRTPQGLRWQQTNPTTVVRQEEASLGSCSSGRRIHSASIWGPSPRDPILDGPSRPSSIPGGSCNSEPGRWCVGNQYLVGSEPFPPLTGVTLRLKSPASYMPVEHLTSAPSPLNGRQDVRSPRFQSSERAHKCTE